MVKRRPSTGAVYQRKDGRWVAAVQVGHGSRSAPAQRRYLYGSSRREVERKLKDALAALDAGLQVPDPKYSVGMHLQGWLDWQRSRVRPSTWVSYEGHVRMHLATLHGIPLIRLAPPDVRRLIVRLLADGLSATTVRYTITVLRMALGQAVDDGVIPRNVAKLVEMPAPDRVEGQALTIPQVRVLLEATKTHRMRALYVVALTTALRQGELLGLRWDDVDWEGRQLAVRAALRPIPKAFREKGDARLQQVEPKTDNAYRAVPLPQVAVDALRAHKERQEGEKVANIEGLVFTSVRGTPLDGRNVTREFQRALTAAKLPSIRFHDLRHTTVSILHAMGVPQDEIRGIAGHGSVVQTWGYTHVLPEVWSHVTQALDEAIG